jgi:hypothetical protein
MSDRLYNSVKANAKKQAKKLVPKSVRKAFKKARQSTVGHIEKTLDTILPGKSSLDKKQSLIETQSNMPKKPGKSKKGKSKGKSRARSVKGLTKTIVKKAVRKTKRAFKKMPKGNGKRTKRRFNMRGRAGRPAGLSARKAFSMDYACFKGRDYVTTLQFSGPNPDGQQILEGPGQVIFKTQLQPWKMVANGRLARCMALFEKWRPKSLTFRLRSGMPGGMNAGTVLAVYEPNVLEKLPPVTLGSDLPDRASLSIYEAHSNAKILQVDPNNKQKDGNTDFSVRVDLQTGPFGGWFFFDSSNVVPIGESSFGQFMIMVQLPMNCLGSSGQYKTNTTINWADLILDYEIECSVANDEPVEAGPGPNTIAAQRTVNATSLYQAMGLSSGAYDLNTVFTANPIKSGACIDDFGAVVAVASNQVSIEIPQVTGNGLLAFLVYSLGTKADAGTTGAGFLSPTCLTYTNNGSSSSAGSVEVASVTNVTSSTTRYMMIVQCPTNVNAPEPKDTYSISPGAWTAGTGGTGSATTNATVEFYALEFPDEWVENTAEEKLSLDNPKVQKLLANLLRQHPEFTPLQVKASHPVTHKPIEEKKGIARVLACPDSDDDWDEPKSLHFDFSQCRTQISESDEKKAPSKTSRPSSLKSSGGKDKEKL